MLKDEADGVTSELSQVVARQGAQIMAADDDRPGLWRFEPAKQREECGLASARRADERDMVALVDVEVQFVEHGEGAGSRREPVNEAVHANGGRRHTVVTDARSPMARRGSDAKALIPSAKSTPAVNPSASAARFGDATTWRTSPRRKRPVTFGVGAPGP